MPPHRRSWLLGSAASLASAALAGCARKTDSARLPDELPGRLLGPDQTGGHRLREPARINQADARDVDVAIVGAGIAGLSAAWRLMQRGVDRVVVLELEHQSGGNARSGGNAVSRYPWGAHYVTLPTEQCRVVRELLHWLGVLHGDPSAKTPSYDERVLCHAPQERLYFDGLWHDGLSTRGLGAPRDTSQFDRFEELIEQFKQARDDDGRAPFALPVSASSRDPRWCALDRLTMRQWLADQRLDSNLLHWYIDYAMRDDYGTSLADVSAWAGIHYFAAHSGTAQNADGKTVLTWPQGNDYVAQRLSAMLGDRLIRAAPVRRVARIDSHASSRYWVEADAQPPLRLRARHVIWAAPLTLAPLVVESLDAARVAGARRISHSSWVVANLSLDRPPIEQGMADLAWDNVLFDSQSLGYVVATHQTIRAQPAATVFTWYRPLADQAPEAARQALRDTDWRHWASTALAELSRPHPDLAARLRSVEVWRWPHAMVRPVPGSLWADAPRLAFEQPWAQIYFAHTDACGLSLFEEAVERGAAAADAIIDR